MFQCLFLFIGSQNFLIHCPLSIGPLVPWSIGPLVHWSIGPLNHWSIEPLNHWSIGALVHWPIGPLVKCQWGKTFVGAYLRSSSGHRTVIQPLIQHLLWRYSFAISNCSSYLSSFLVIIITKIFLLSTTTTILIFRREAGGGGQQRGGLGNVFTEHNGQSKHY